MFTECENHDQDEYVFIDIESSCLFSYEFYQ